MHFGEIPRRLIAFSLSARVTAQATFSVLYRSDTAGLKVLQT